MIIRLNVAYWLSPSEFWRVFKWGVFELRTDGAWLMHRDETYKRSKSRDSSRNEKGERTSRQSVTSHEIWINNQIFYHSHQRHGLALSRFVDNVQDDLLPYVLICLTVLHNLDFCNRLNRKPTAITDCLHGLHQNTSWNKCLAMSYPILDIDQLTNILIWIYEY